MSNLGNSRIPRKNLSAQEQQIIIDTIESEGVHAWVDDDHISVEQITHKDSKTLMDLVRSRLKSRRR